MKLLEITRQIHRLDAEKTIYAKKPWLNDTEALLYNEPEERLVPSELQDQGYEYFLEVFIAQELIPDLSHAEASFTLEQWCQKLIHYAESDA